MMRSIEATNSRRIHLILLSLAHGFRLLTFAVSGESINGLPTDIAYPREMTQRRFTGEVCRWA